MKRLFFLLFILLYSYPSAAQDLTIDPQMYDIIDSVSADRLESDIRTLAGFGTRHTMSDTASDTRGIGTLLTQ